VEEGRFQRRDTFSRTGYAALKAPLFHEKSKSIS